MANSVDPDQTAPIGAVCSGSTLFASILNSSVILGNFLQQTTSADDIFRCIFFMALEGLTHSVLVTTSLLIILQAVWTQIRSNILSGLIWVQAI